MSLFERKNTHIEEAVLRETSMFLGVKLLVLFLFVLLIPSEMQRKLRRNQTKHQHRGPPKKFFFNALGAGWNFQ